MKPATSKYCYKCEDTRPAEEFYSNAARLDGLSQHCKACTKEYEKTRAKSGFNFQKKKSKPIPKDVKLADQPEKIKELVGYLIENPKISCEELAQKLERTTETVRHYMSQNVFLRALRSRGMMRVTQMIPAALDALNGSLHANSEEVRLKAATKVLENEKILGPERMDITVSSLADKSVQELQEMYKSQTPPPEPTIIEAEFIS